MENEPTIPPAPPPAIPAAVPSRKAQSWGAFISIIVIVLMIIIGAFYAWGQRISESNLPIESTIP
ncbi:MAG: hypothetical protein WC798_01650 [Candidatus Paceibacterota bacterium]|jgi:hypothetical protein